MLSFCEGSGDLKKMLAGLTGLHPNDQKLIYKEKERNSRAFLDEVGVTNGSKLVLTEDVLSRERRVLESRRSEKIDKASKAIAEIRLEIDKLAKQVKIGLEVLIELCFCFNLFSLSLSGLA